MPADTSYGLRLDAVQSCLPTAYEVGVSTLPGGA